MSTIKFFLWITPDSSRVLGQGLSRETAYADAQKRHPEKFEGYCCEATLSNFPADRGAHPLKTIVEGLWAIYPASVRDMNGAGSEPFEPAETDADNVKPLKGATDKAG